MWNWRAIGLVFLPFAAGYYLSYLFRIINALISAQLTAEFSLGAAGLGLLTSVYFLTFAAAQLPIGVLLDRYGPPAGPERIVAGRCGRCRAVWGSTRVCAACPRPRAGRTRGLRRVDLGVQGPCSLFSEAALGARQWLHGHAGGARRRNRDGLQPNCWSPRSAGAAYS